MNKRFGVQALVVIALIALVSWPEFYTSQPDSVWRFAPELQQTAEAAELNLYRYADDQRTARRGTGSLFGPDSVNSVSRYRRLTDAAPVPGTFFVPQGVTEAGGKINAVLGRARTSLNTPIPYARVLLRNLRTGAIEARATANEEGRYSFLDVDASAYIVELLGADGTVVAASEMVAMTPGDLRETTVRVSATAATTAATFNGRLTGSLVGDTTGIASGNGATDGSDTTNDGRINPGTVTRTADTTTDVDQESAL